MAEVGRAAPVPAAAVSQTPTSAPLHGFLL